jgi:hypothetical protein
LHVWRCGWEDFTSQSPVVDWQRTKTVTVALKARALQARAWKALALKALALKARALQALALKALALKALAFKALAFKALALEALASERPLRHTSESPSVALPVGDGTLVERSIGRRRRRCKSGTAH